MARILYNSLPGAGRRLWGFPRGSREQPCPCARGRDFRACARPRVREKSIRSTVASRSAGRCARPFGSRDVSRPLLRVRIAVAVVAVVVAIVVVVVVGYARASNGGRESAVARPFPRRRCPPTSINPLWRNTLPEFHSVRRRACTGCARSATGSPPSNTRVAVQSSPFPEKPTVRSFPSICPAPPSFPRETCKIEKPTRRDALCPYPPC